MVEKKNIMEALGKEEVFWIVAPEEAGQRIDQFLTAHDPQQNSRSFWQRLLKQGQVAAWPAAADCDPATAAYPRPNYQLRAGEQLCARIPAPQELRAEAEDIPLEVVFEDGDLIVVNKPRGMVVHPAAGNYTGTLVNALLGYCRDLSGINGVLRPGIVHRLDKDTTGLILAAKNDRAHQRLAEVWHSGAVNRFYLALLHGSMAEPGGTIDAPLGRSPADRKKMAVLPGGGRQAITHYQVLERPGPYTLVRCKLATGRTHQIRVHMKYLGHPVVGDPIYGPRNTPAVGLLLHSARLAFIHPISGRQIELTAPLPPDFADFLAAARQAGQP